MGEDKEVEGIVRLFKLMDNGNADAYHQLACYYASGTNGMPQNRAKANELWLKAGELGCAEAYSRLGYSYANGMGVGRDEQKAKHYWELAAMNGNVKSRYNLGLFEGKAGNHQRAKKHFIVAARAGHPESLDVVKKGFMEGYATKEEYTKEEYAGTLRAYHESQTEMKSEARDEASALKAR